MRTRFALPLLALIALSACQLLSPGVRTEPLQTVTTSVTDRHDAYVEADSSLVPELRAEFLSQSAALDALMAGSAEVNQTTLREAVAPVVVRHDGYVNGDTALTELERRTFIRSSLLLRQAAGMED